jgi:hypothetical protein
VERKPESNAPAASGRTTAAIAAASALSLFLVHPSFAADPLPPWETSPGFPAETDFLRDRIDHPQNHFLLNGEEGFVSGREYYQAYSEALPFLWPVQPFLRYGTGRGWMTDTTTLDVEAYGSSETNGDPPSPYADGEVSWQPLEGLRLHGGLEQNGLYSRRTFPARQAQAGIGNEADLAWFGEQLPIRSQANIGGALDRRGAILGGQYNYGWWWTTSPVSGQTYAWEGFNADLVYKAGDDFELSLVGQHWDSRSPFEFYDSHWRRSEITLSFSGVSIGAWMWRLDAGFQRRDMTSSGAFEEFEDQEYPFRYRYRQDWIAPDSMNLRILNQGHFGYRDNMFSAVHSSEFRETFGPHQPMQFVRAYYRHQFKNGVIPVERLSAQDSTAIAAYHPGVNARGFVGGLEYREARKKFQVGVAADYAMEWEYVLFEPAALDTVDGLIRRQGIYEGSDKALSNAVGRVFASGTIVEQVDWRAQGGLRGFWGDDAEKIEFLPSPWWAGAGLKWNMPAKARFDAQVTWLGEKEVRGWGPDFKVPSHWENQVSFLQPIFGERLKFSLTALHAFGENVLEQPNGNLVRFRILAGIEGTVY